jgi:hypothetical protein
MMTSNTFLSTSDHPSKASLLPIVAFAEKKMPLTARPCRLPLLRRFLALLSLCLIVIFMIYTYQNRGESSYLDLVLDNLIPDYPDAPLDKAVSSSLGTLSKSPIVYCRDQEGWISEWLSSGSMPKCSLADQSKVDILYAYIPTVKTNKVGSTALNPCISRKNTTGKTSRLYSEGAEPPTIARFVPRNEDIENTMNCDTLSDQSSSISRTHSIPFESSRVTLLRARLGTDRYRIG